MVEVLVFCEPGDKEVVDAAMATAGWAGRVFADGIRSGPSRKRNLLLAEATGASVMFLDDDSLFAGGEAEWARLLSMADGTRWLLFDVVFTHSLGAERRRMKTFRPGDAGSGIEWNQLWPTNHLRELGGWPEDFCTGERWKSGGALVLAIQFWNAGFRQTPCPGVVFSHPRQVFDNSGSSVAKGRRYRYAIGAIYAGFGSKLTRSERLSWALRLGLLSPVGAFPALLRGRWALATIRLLTPFDAIRGCLDFRRSREPAMRPQAR